MKTISLEELLEAGSHFGHQVRRWNPSMKKYIYGERDGIHILDLAQSKACLEEAAEYLKKVAADGGQILFVGTKRQAAELVKQTAIKAGMPYMTNRWIGGLLTNFEMISGRIRKMKDMMAARESGEYKKYTKREQLLLDREILKLQKSFAGVALMDKLPTVMFVVDAHKEEVAVLEAIRMKIPVVGMVDTNGRVWQLDKIIPVNDDAAKSIELCVGFIGDAICDGVNSKTSDFAKATPDKQDTSTKDEVSVDEEKPKKVKKVSKTKKA